MTRNACVLTALLAVPVLGPAQAPGPRPHVAIRGIYGGVPQEILDSGRSLQEFGMNAVWVGSGSLTAERVALLRAQRVRVFAEFNTLHVADYLKDHPDAAPVGADGRPSPPPDGWQGICPHPRRLPPSRMAAFRGPAGALRGRRHLARLPPRPRQLGAGRAQPARHLLLRPLPATVSGRLRRATARPTDAASEPRCCYRPTAGSGPGGAWTCSPTGSASSAIRDATRPRALLGTFHSPWSDEDFGGARLRSWRST